MRTKHYSGRRSPFPTIGKVSFSLLGIFVLLGVCLLLFAVITEYRPDAITRLTVSGSSNIQTARRGQQYSLTTFNIGYCGRDAGQDDFREGGQHSGAGSLTDVENNLAAVSDFLVENPASFVFLQEVDVNSRRSFGVNQRDFLENLFPDRAALFAMDFKSPFVPLPLLSPIGRVESGLFTLSLVAVRESTRVSFEGSRSFPNRLFYPNDCFLVTRVAVENGGDLVLINVRFPDDATADELRAVQLEQLKAYLLEESEKGHYIILGGDFGRLLPGTDADVVSHNGQIPNWGAVMPESFSLAGFHWAVDPDIPTRRAGNRPYVKGESYAAVTDGFLITDNIEVLSVQTSILDFQNASHNPVSLLFSLL